MSVGEHHDPDRELFGQGVPNLAAPLLGGIPATAAIARTAVNVRAGARSRLATTIRMVEVGSLRALARSTRSDRLVLVLTFTVTVIFDLVTAVAVGIGVAIVLALRTIARTAQLRQVPLEGGDHK